MIRTLHLFANHKITGPAELALETARWQNLTDSGLDAFFYSSWVKSQGEKKDRWLQILARKRQVKEPDWNDVKLSKHFSPVAAFLDRRRLIKHLNDFHPQVVHCHSNNDHLLGGAAARGSRHSDTLVVRTLYDGEVPQATRRLKYSFKHYTDHLICLSEAVAAGLREGGFDIPEDRITVSAPPIDTERFDPERPLPNIRERLGIAAEAPVYGIVARMQTHRRFEVLIEAMKRVAKEMPEARGVIVGRGTNQQTVAREPVAKAGLSEQVLFSGYLADDDYVGVLKAMDLKLFLVPGSDGTCRAVREALSMGRPVLAAKRGMLPEIVRHGVTGRVIEDSAELLATNILELLSDRDALKQLGAQARQDALERFSFRSYAQKLAEIYQACRA